MAEAHGIFSSLLLVISMFVNGFCSDFFCWIRAFKMGFSDSDSGSSFHGFNHAGLENDFDVGDNESG